MALLDEIEPPSTEDKKTKIFINLFSKSKNHFQKFCEKISGATNFVEKTKKCLVFFANENKYIKILLGKTAKSNMVSYAVIFVITGVVISTNFLVSEKEYALASLEIAEPEKEASVSAEADKFTPLIKDDKSAVEKVQVISTDAFSDVKTTVSTQITEREEPLPNNSSSAVAYTVRPGDTLTTLGWKFGVKVATIKYVNDLNDADSIKPGQQLKISQRGYEVSASAIAKKAQEKEKARLAAANRSTTYRDSSSSRSGGKPVVNYQPGSRNNSYPYGYCTYYVATKRAVGSNWGNAKNWLNSARSAGYSTGSAPAVGAIGVTSESWWGHVTYVEAVDGDSVTISEMNYAGWGVVNRRTVSASHFRGFIY